MSRQPFNPFAQLTPEFLQVVLDNRKLKRDAEQQYDALLSAYKALLSDPKYVKIKTEVFASAGKQVKLLLAQASKCHSGCAAQAERINLLLEVLACPIEAVLEAETQARLQEQASDGE